MPQPLPLELTIRDLEPTDLSDLDWSGGMEHIAAVASALGESYTGNVRVLVIVLPNGRLVSAGAVDFRRDPQAGTLWMLAVHETLQGLGIGTLLIGALEQAILDRGLGVARLDVEHDNPRAAALYRRLGYVEAGTELDSWPVAGGRTYVTACTVLRKVLRREIVVDPTA